MKKKLYLAGPLFSQAERQFNFDLKGKLIPYFDVFLPQEDGVLVADLIKSGADPKEAFRRAFNLDLEAMDSADIGLIVLDGRTVDEGAVFELGYMYAKGKECFGLKTDPRQLLTHGNNPMIDCSIKKIFPSVDKLLEWAKTF